MARPGELSCARAVLPEAASLNLMYLGGALLVLAQCVGIYGLFSRKADLVLSLIVGVILIAGILIGGLGVYRQLS